MRIEAHNEKSRVLLLVISQFSSQLPRRTTHGAHRESPYHNIPIDENCFYVHITFSLCIILVRFFPFFLSLLERKKRIYCFYFHVFVFLPVADIVERMLLNKRTSVPFISRFLFFGGKIRVRRKAIEEHFLIILIASETDITKNKTKIRKVHLEQANRLPSLSADCFPQSQFFDIS